MTIENYQWVPGCGPSAISLQRMREQIKKPEEPMGEAWFMSKKRLLFLGDDGARSINVV
jgi:hypothetical protein